MKKHLESCVRRAIDIKKQREEFNEQYPYHCRHCEGWGGTISVDDPSLSVAPMMGDGSVDVDTCDHCIGSGKCPRCGSQLFVDDNEPCSFCGYEVGVTQGKPYPHACFCHELENEIYS